MKRGHREQLCIWIEPDKKQQLKILCVQNGLTMQDVLYPLIIEVLEGKHEDLIEQVKRGKGS